MGPCVGVKVQVTEIGLEKHMRKTKETGNRARVFILNLKIVSLRNEAQRSTRFC